MQSSEPDVRGTALPVVGAQRLAKAKAASRAKGVSNPWSRFSWIMASVWLVFLFYPVMSLVRTTASPAWAVCGWVALVVFVAVYLVMFKIGVVRGVAGSGGVSRTQYLLLATLVACIVAIIPAVGTNTVSFFPFLVSTLAYQFRPWLYWLVSALCLGILVWVVLTAPDGPDYLGLLAILVILILVNAVSTWLITRSMEADKLALELATSEEREAVARDVHDLIGHSLTVVKLKAQLARRLMESDPDRARAELEEIERITGEAIQGVRATVTGLRADGLAAQLDSARVTLQTAGIELSVEGDASVLSPAQALPAGWILREAITNVLRHAQATRVSVMLRPGELVVQDNGVGCAGKPGRRVPGVPHAQRPVAGNGLHGMAERAALSGGRCSVRPGAQGGMIVEVTW